SLIPMLISERTVSVADMINAKLDDVSSQIEQVGNKVGSLRAKVNKLVETNQASINDFLKSAGYKYSVKILSGGDSYRMILEHHDATGHLDAATTHLSYGEKNAFALVLFMHHVKQAKPDLVILDDPVSSFDKTKKFAIMHKLFHDDNGIRNFTTLFLTHDIEPVIDVLVSGPLRRGLAGRSVAHFLRTEVGVLREKAIARGDVSTFAQICDSNISSASDATIKCIYLRRKLEVGGDYGSAYQLLSSFLHLKQPATKTGADDRQVGMTASEIQDGVAEIRCHIPEFDYDLLVAEVLVPGALIERFDAAKAGYEKVQIFRIFLKLPMVEKKGSTPFQKFVNESLHIENEYVMQLNPRDFDAVPEYIIDECAKLIDVHRD
ncbi:AAA family ATPase, partial [Mycolicibacterium fortuitum]